MRRRPVPSERITQTSSASECRNAIRCPSGDQTAPPSSSTFPGPCRTIDRPRPFARSFTIVDGKTSPTYFIGSKSVVTNAPSGDQETPSVICSPETCTRNVSTCRPRGRTSLILPSVSCRATSRPSGDQAAFSATPSWRTSLPLAFIVLKSSPESVSTSTSSRSPRGDHVTAWASGGVLPKSSRW